MLSEQIRRQFLEFFKKRQHAVIPSSSVVPHDDPTLLFINAGMNQFKDVFLGKSERDYSRAATAQKCIRVGGKHNDLDNVGHTSRHLTFFEMLGNFSFGNYFKEQAILYAWEVSTTIFGFDSERIWVTIFQEDDEAWELWKKIVPEKRIVRMGEKDNFWAMGETGPCGPCSELYYDRGGADVPSPKEDEAGERFLEFWNLVFMQYNRDTSGQLQPLPKQSIDTGAGLERIISLKMGVESVFETDILRNLIAQIEEVSKKRYEPKDSATAPAFHVIADHIRSLSFAIADGVQPSNVERGYILRKLLRRALRYGRNLGLQEPFLGRLLPRLIDTMGRDYPELVFSKSRIAEVLFAEEEAFIRTLKRGGNILNTVVEKAQGRAQKQISGEDAFKLKDTYGFPLEEILLIAKDTGLEVNLDSYKQLEEQAKERSRSSRSVEAEQVEETIFKEFSSKHPACTFVGYTQMSSKAEVKALIVEGAFVPVIREGQEGIILLDRTPFYAEKGGQVGDKGTLTSEGVQFNVLDCSNPYPGVIAHQGKLLKGELAVGDRVDAQVESLRRQNIARNHTATHLLHWALQQVLGAHIRQAGSIVDDHRLRFDFNHHKALTKEEIRHVERLVNEKVRESRDVKSYEISYDEAQKHSEIKQFFGEKYGAKVRVIDIDYSKELCGGTHTHNVGTIGLFRIVKEGSISAGVRRIEALTGALAETYVYETEDDLLSCCEQLKTTPAHLVERVAALIEENKRDACLLKGFKRARLKSNAEELVRKAQEVAGIPLIAASVDVESALVQEFIEDLSHLLRSGVILLGIKTEGKCQLIAKISADLWKKGFSAVELIKEIAPCIEGSGGGKEGHAQAGGKKPEGITLAFEKAKQWLIAKS